MRPFLAALLIGVAVPAGSAPQFVPSPRQAFEGFVAINAPRPDVPVGALWIEGYGPTGEGATPDNLETVRSLSGMTIDRNLQISLTAGLFDLIGIEPRLRSHFNARFGDLQLVRVKDVSRLSGPAGEPRIVEAIRAGSIVVSSDGEAGLNARAGWKLEQVEGSGTSGRTRAHSIEGRDLFIAIRVATQKRSQSAERDVKLAGSDGRWTGRIEDFQLIIQPAECAEAQPCDGQRRIGIIKLTSWPAGSLPALQPLKPEGPLELPLPVPITDERGGLYTRMVVRLTERCSPQENSCRRAPRLQARFEGDRIEDLKSPDAARW